MYVHGHTIVNILTVCNDTQRLRQRDCPQGLKACGEFRSIICLDRSWQGGGYIQGVEGANPHPITSEPPPLCDIPSGCCSFTGPWRVTCSSLHMLRRVTAFCRPLRPVVLLVSWRSPVVGVFGLC